MQHVLRDELSGEPDALPSPCAAVPAYHVSLGFLLPGGESLLLIEKQNNNIRIRQRLRTEWRGTKLERQIGGMEKRRIVMEWLGF